MPIPKITPDKFQTLTQPFSDQLQLAPIMHSSIHMIGQISDLIDIIGYLEIHLPMLRIQLFGYFCFILIVMCGTFLFLKTKKTSKLVKFVIPIIYLLDVIVSVFVILFVPENIYFLFMTEVVRLRASFLPRHDVSCQCWSCSGTVQLQWCTGLWYLML